MRKQRMRCRIPALGWLAVFSLCMSDIQAQETFPVNGITDKRLNSYAFTRATLVKDAQTIIQNATLVVKDGKIVAAGVGATIPKEAIVLDCQGKYIYPSFIDVYSDYGLQAVQRSSAPFNFLAPAQLTSNQKGAYGWNQAIRSDIHAGNLFAVDESKAKSIREQGFGTVLTHQRDGIVRGTGVLATLGNDKENMVILKDKASTHYSFSKGISTQSYPSSMMGSIALLRQTFLDAQWYKQKTDKEGTNLTLQYFNEQQSLPALFEANDKWNALRADRIGDEFGVQFVIKGSGNEYQRITEMASTKATFILPLNFPQAMDVEDPADARFVSMADMKHWEMAPGNPAAFEKANIPFCLTTSDMRSTSQFLANLRKSVEYGLSEQRALDALTKTPASLLGVYNMVGSLDPGKMANFIITNGPIFQDKTAILQNWIQGKRYVVKEEGWNDIRGQYQLVMLANGNVQRYTMDLKSNNNAQIIGKDTLNARVSTDGKTMKLSFSPDKKSKGQYRLSGINNGNSWSGTGEDSLGNRFTWTADMSQPLAAKTEAEKKKDPIKVGAALTYPFGSYGWKEMPKAQTMLIKNATVWTNESAGVLAQTDVLIRNGKIVQVGKNITDNNAIQIDGTGKHLTAGIIDEHSHIAVSSINEGGQSVTSEVRIADNLNPDDINIYWQLSGGVTSSHILHGSANTIGGQTQLIKLRWGANDDQLKFTGWPGFIKFALGENVKRSGSIANNRFPDSRMGVEEVLMDAFHRAKAYETDKKNALAKKLPFRKDLELEALVEIMNKERFITCHSYVQSEIIAAMRVADKYNFNINTFTHILEGYKVADKMKAHGVAASTFSDWWNYKMEVLDAIPYNATLMHQAGLNVAINSDDAEMARRLNHEAAKSVKYGGMSEEDAWKMVTLNPAKMLHVDDKVGSIKVGKDADLVLWSDNPLSIYAKSEKTIVDGIVYFDRAKDQQMRKETQAERNRLIQKMIAEKRNGGSVSPASPSGIPMYHCSDHLHSHGLLAIDLD